MTKKKAQSLVYLFEQFDRVYCINLSFRKDRWVETQNQLIRLGIKNVERFSAVENKKNPAKGCADSHEFLIKNAKKNGFKQILILEDDVEILTKNIVSVDGVIRFLKTNKNWTLFYLGGRAIVKSKNISKNVVKGRFYSTHAYAVNILNYDFHIPIELPIDVFYSNQFDESFCAYPILAGQRESYSDISKKNIDWKNSEFEQSLFLSKYLPTNFIKILFALTEKKKRLIQFFSNNR